MDEDFDIPVLYNDIELNFKTKLLKFGYTYKFEVDVYGIPVIFEPDEERNLRAIIDLATASENKFDRLFYSKLLPQLKVE